MGVRSTTVLAPLSALLLACVLTTSCALGDDDQEADPERLQLEAAAGALSVSVLRPGAERAFARDGHTLDGGLDCANEAPAAPSADPGGTGPAGEDAEEAGGSGQEGGDGRASPAVPGEELAVHCTGVTDEGEEVVFEGRLARADLAAREAGDDSLHGSFTGSVAGETVFDLDCFQCAPAADADGPQDEEASDAGGTDDGGTEAATDD
ncbi:hypothetical protein DFP74_4684 [Nocardiopsis sp. Huas11]|uniref:hypothetical protein n=1 Tax=Nocardiopsis sp. Huas11 TaxID=2183912 RepID=UPI000EADE0C9|nr:hypothetical protein [Nocardiopsis sp. Huas11]RKS08957.1 hypothetical protein DFP74_4684 [Nocardiopsis sp. Huas11]